MKKIFRVYSVKVAPDGSPREWNCLLIDIDGKGYEVECGHKYNKGHQLEVPIVNNKPVFSTASAALGDIVSQSKYSKEKEVYELYVRI